MLILNVLAILGICLCLAWAANPAAKSAPASGPAPAPATGGAAAAVKHGKRGKNITTGPPIKRVLVDEEVRKLNWCVTGRDEPEMQYYPYSDFQPYLARTDTGKKRFRDNYGKVKYDYKLFLDEIKFSDDDEHIFSATSGIGRGYPDYTPTGKMHNTAHLKFMAYTLRPYPLGVKIIRKPKLIEGLVIQVNQSPLGIGTATAQFMDPELEIICGDCRHPQGRPVGCRKRTKNDIVPPTIMMYHHQMPIYDSYRTRTNPKPATPVGCLLCREDLKPAGPTTTPPEFCRCTRRVYDPTFDINLLRDCSNKPLLQTVIPDCDPDDSFNCPCYSCLCQKSGPTNSGPPCQCNEFQRTSAPIKFGSCVAPGAPLGPPTPNRCDIAAGDPRCACTGPPENEPEKACHPTGTGIDQCRCIDTDLALPQGSEVCLASGSLKDCVGVNVPGTPAVADFKCRRKEAVIYPDCVADNTIKGCSEHDDFNKYLASIRNAENLGPASEIHANLQWYFPPCLRSRAVEFMALIIHSFANQEYEIIFFGPYELPSLQTYPDHSQRVPSPYFHGYSKLYICDDPRQATTLFANTDRIARASYPFEYSYNYDQCIRELSIQDVDGGQFCPQPEAYRCDDQEEMKYTVVFDRKCSELCDSTTVMPNATAKPKPLPTPHGAINIITNFCIQPIAIFIGRYYKETLNRNSYRGMQLWYWVHFLGSGLASVAMYIGYFHPKWVHRSNSHVIAGNTIMILLALTYVSSWIRHTNKWFRMFAEFFHGSCGYCCSFMAYWCLHTVPISLTAKILVYTATSCLGAGYLVMEGCIFYLDHKFGMRPHRRHFPTVEERLGDLPVPGTKWRIFFLFCLFISMLVLTTVAAMIYPS